MQLALNYMFPKPAEMSCSIYKDILYFIYFISYFIYVGLTLEASTILPVSVQSRSTSQSPTLSSLLSPSSSLRPFLLSLYSSSSSSSSSSPLSMSSQSSSSLLSSMLLLSLPSELSSSILLLSSSPYLSIPPQTVSVGQQGEHYSHLN